MTQVEKHRPGAFCWADLATSDPEGAKAFYTELFGWDVNDVPAGEAARPWLFVVAKRVLYRRRRGVRRFRRLVEKAGTVRHHGGPDPETVVVQRAEYATVLEAASRLSVRDREVLNLAAWEGLPHSEISEILGCSIAAVDQRLHRAKQRLAKQYHAARQRPELRHAAGGEGS